MFFFEGGKKSKKRKEKQTTPTHPKPFRKVRVKECSRKKMPKPKRKNKKLRKRSGKRWKIAITDMAREEEANRNITKDRNFFS